MSLAELESALPDGVVLTDPDVLESYRRDWSEDASAGTPIAVVRVSDAAQVQETMRWATRHRVPVVPRGAGTGVSGGSSAVDGGVVLSLERLRAIEIDIATRVAVVEPGALNVEVKQAAAAHGLWYPPDPSSFEICSVGGNIATNAGGLCCVKYGVTTDYVLGLDVVLADGTLIVLGGKRIKDVAGLSLLKLFVGSEGTLGIVTRAVLRLVPAQPPRSTLVASFAAVSDAADAVVAVGRTMRPSMMELMDRASINAVEDYKSMGLDRSTAALLVAQSDAPGAARGDEVETMRAACQVAGATEVFVTDDAEEGELFVAARRMAFPAIQARGRCCSRTSACRCRSCPSCCRGSPPSLSGTTWRSRSSPTPATATPIPWSSTPPSPRTRPGPRSLRSCARRSPWAGPSPASTVSAEPSAMRCRTSWGRT